MNFWTYLVFENIENYYNFASGKGLLERLAAGPVIGDGGFIFALEKRGFVKVSKTLSCQTLFSKLTKKIFLTFQAGPWTPEATVEHPDAVGHLPSTLLFSLGCYDSVFKLPTTSSNTNPRCVSFTGSSWGPARMWCRWWKQMKLQKSKDELAKMENIFHQESAKFR